MTAIQTAIVGFGFAGRDFHCYLVGLVPQMRLYGVVSGRRETHDEIRSRYRARPFVRFEDMLADDRVDLVVLATPNDQHAPQAIAALDAGKHVVTEKPMCLHASEAREMIAAAQRNGKLLSVFQNRRWDGDYLTVRKALTEGAVGDLVSLELGWNQPGKPRTWRSEARHGGGRFVDLGSHMIDQALQLVASPVTRVYAQFFSEALPNDVEDHAHCLLTFANGVVAHVTTSSLARAPKRRWFVVGTLGTLIKRGFDPQQDAMKSGDIDEAREDASDYAQLFCAGDGGQKRLTVPSVAGRWRCYYENVAAALLGEAELAVTPQSVLSVVRVLDAAALSAARGEAVGLV